MKDIFSFVTGLSVIGLVFISWVMLAKLLKKRQKSKLAGFLILKYIVLTLLIVALIYFDMTNLYFFCGTFVGIMLIIAFVLIKADKFIKQYDGGK